MARRPKKQSDPPTADPSPDAGHTQPAAPRSQPQVHVAVVAVLVLASGCAALIFQVAWMRELRLVFGSTTASVSAVLAIFMGGLGVGSAVLGPRADRSMNPLRMYGALEVGIASSVALTPWLVSLVSWIYIGLGGQASLGLAGASAVRVLLSSLVMFVPAFLMGGTLPAAVRAVTSTGDAHRRALGVLYGANTLGAVAGSAVATFVVLESLGTRITLWAGCALGLAAGGLAMLLSHRVFRPPAGYRTNVDEAAPSHERDDDIATTIKPGLTYLIAAILGFTFFALEIVWFRMLAPILGGTTFTFGLILCVALLGIGVGGLAYNFLFIRLRPTWTALAITCGLEAAFGLIPFALGDRIAMLAAWYGHDAGGFGDLIFGWMVVTSIVVLPVALVSGVQFPLLIALLGQGRQSVSRHLGTVYAWNTIGAVAGSLIAGFGALPLLGAKGVWLALGGLMALLSMVVLVSAGKGTGRRGMVTAVGLAALTVATMFSTGPTAAWRHSGIGAGRSVISAFDKNSIEYWRGLFRNNVIWEADGIEASIGIKQIHGHDFVVNGKVDGNSLKDAPTQVGVAILGAVIHPDPKTALVIGLGTGESAGWLAEMRNIRSVDVVELEPAIDEMASICADLNFDVLNHPRVRRIYNDGREFVLSADEHYDVIVSEPSNPYRAGVATLYTTEFYEAARERLNPGGVFVQFLQAYEVNTSTIETVLSTIHSAFRHVEVWQTRPSDMQLVCSDSPIRYTADQLRERISDPTVHRALRDVWRSPDLDGFLAHFVINSRWVDKLARETTAPLNTDDRTVLEYSFAKTVGQATSFSVEQFRTDLAGGDWVRPDLERGQVDWRSVELRRQYINCAFDGMFSIALLPRPEDQALIRALIHYRQDEFAAALARWPAGHLQPESDLGRLILARCQAELARAECLELLEALGPRFPNDAAAVRVIYHSRAGEPAEAERWFHVFVDGLRTSPWTIPSVSEPAFALAVELAQADRESAKRLYPLFVEPYAASQFNYIREMARWWVGKEIGYDMTIEALAPLEPLVPWRADLLEARAQIYRETNHPRAETAKREWERFQRQRPSE